MNAEILLMVIRLVRTQVVETTLLAGLENARVDVTSPKEVS